MTAETPRCILCGCSDSNCLVRIQETGHWVCNGSGSMFDAHAVYYMKKTAINHFQLHESNPFAKTQLECIVCGSNAVTDLGFLQDSETKKTFITCADCQYDPKVKLGDKQQFYPFISGGVIDINLVKRPAEGNYKKVTVADSMKIISEVQASLGLHVSSIDEEEKLHPMKFMYKSEDEYAEILIPIIQAEMNKALTEARKTIYRDIKITWKDERTITVPKKGGVSRAMKLHSIFIVGDKISPKSKNLENAHVSKVERHSITLKFIDAESQFFGKEKLSFQLTANPTTYTRQIKAVNAFSNCITPSKNEKKKRQFDPYIPINAPALPIRKVLLGQTEGDDFGKENRAKKLGLEPLPSARFPKLNPSQIKAAEYALSHHFSFIQGPPGTGKTTVLVSIVNSLVKAGVKPVLVCGPSNVTADFAAMRLRDAGLDVARAYSLALSEFIAKDIEGDHKIPGFRPEDYDLMFKARRELGKEHGKLLGKERREVLEKQQELAAKADVVCSTLSNTSSPALDIPFRAVVVDEAGQVTDPLLVQSIAHGASRLVVIGDHMQLGPVVLSTRAKKARLDVTLLVRAMANGLKPKMLEVQYRMHPEIAAFPSKEFYYGLLRNGVDPTERRLPKLPLPFPNPSSPVLFWHVPSRDSDSSSSKLNVNEAVRISDLIDELYQNEVEAKSIGIISPYIAHNTHLINTLPMCCSSAPKDYVEHIEIATVDAFQGREKDIIILSLVRANDNYDIGFLSDKRRLNVSLTRAKCGLAIVGNADTYMKNETWVNLINSFSERGALVTGDDLHSLTPYTPKQPPPEEPKDEDVA